MKYLAILSFLGLVLLPQTVFADTPGFVPLTNIPNLTDVGNSVNLTNFLNNIYRLCIGIAAVLAVLQIMRAGIIYMGGDSVTEKKEAKNLIGLAIAGLVLVLSPVIVFSIINPDILDLKIDGIDALRSAEPTGETDARRIIEVASADDCREQGGRVDDEGPPVICSVEVGSDADDEATSCEVYNDPPESPIASPGRCDLTLDERYVAINDSCCAGLQEGGVCCGKTESSGEQPPQVFLNDPLIYYRYQEYNRRENRGTYVGVVPAHADRVQGFVNACTAAGREVEYSRDDNWAERFVLAQWGECPADVGVPASTGNDDTVYQCEDMRAICRPAET